MARLKCMAPRVGTMAARVSAPPKLADPFYSSSEWRALVQSRKKDGDYRAAMARRKPGERVILDHVHEIKDGGASLDPRNTQWLTFGEHQAKTAAARRRRAFGQA